MTAGGGRPYLHVLGGVQALRDGRDIPLGGAKQRAVLARLVLARRRAVSIAQLLTLWPDLGAGATATLHTGVSRLRRALGAEVIVTNPAGYRLDLPDSAVDAWCFEDRLTRAATAHALGDNEGRARELSEALDGWRGAAYADYRDADWAQPEIARLDELHELAREGLAAARLDLGHPAADLVPSLEALVAEAPLREERWRLLALALYRSHRQADALAALRRARDVLTGELGIDPGPALRALEAQVLQQAPELTRRAAPEHRSVVVDVTAGAESRQLGVAGTHRTGGEILLERDHDLRVLDVALAEAAAGHGSTVAVVGSPGIGKSRLIAELRAHCAGNGSTVLTARGSILEQQFGFGIVRQLFEATIHSESGAAGGGLLHGPAAGAGAVFAPPSTNSGAQSDDAGYAVLNALYWLSVALAARGPLVLIVDDIQWCDLESTRFLAYLSRRLDQLPVLLVYTERTGERFAAADLVHELEQDPRTRVVRPRPLSPSAAGALVSARLGTEVDADFAAACHDVSGGNPLLLRQLVQTLEHDRVPADKDHAAAVRATGSRAVAAMVLPRLRALPEPAGATARAIAVLGDGAELPQVAALAEVDEQQAAAATTRLASAEILALSTSLAFVHPLVREAVYSDIGVGDRPLLHERAARLLDSAGADPEAVAAQLLHAPHRGSPWTVEALRRAATAAAGRAGSEAMVSYLRRALSEPCPQSERPSILYDLGRAETARYGPAALLHLEDAYEQLPDTTRRVAAAQQLARTMIFAAPPGTATEFAQRVAADLPSDLSDERQAMQALARMGGHMGGLPAGQWRSGPEPVVEGHGPGAHMLRAALAWDRLCQAKPREEAVELSRTALSDGSLYRADNGLLWVVATTTMEFADVDVMPLWDKALSVANEEGSLFAALSVHLWRGLSLFRAGRLREAMDSVQLSVEEMRMWDSNLGVVYARAIVAAIHRELGDLTAADAVLSQDIAAFPGTDGERLLIEARAELHLARGRPEQALATLEPARTLVPHVINPVWRREPSIRAQALLALGERDAAAGLLLRETELARSWGAPSSLARVLLLLAQAYPDDAHVLLSEAVAITEGSRVRLDRARCLQALGTHLRTREPDRAAALHAEARGVLLACGVVRSSAA